MYKENSATIALFITATAFFAFGFCLTHYVKEKS